MSIYWSEDFYVYIILYIQASVKLGPEDVSLLERCPHFRGCYVQASFQRVLCTGFNGEPEDVSLLEMCTRIRACTDVIMSQRSTSHEYS